jgi:hypothetical protein
MRILATKSLRPAASGLDATGQHRENNYLFRRIALDVGFLSVAVPRINADQNASTGGNVDQEVFAFMTTEPNELLLT